MNLVYSMLLIFGTTAIHALCTVGLLRWSKSFSPGYWGMRSLVGRASALSMLVFLMTLIGYFEAALWAVFYVWVDALPTLREALYFSMVTFTTLGYGDITLNDRWRILASVEAANGLILFGWTTAIIIAFVQRVFSIDTPVDDGS